MDLQCICTGVRYSTLEPERETPIERKDMSGIDKSDNTWKMQTTHIFEWTEWTNPNCADGNSISRCDAWKWIFKYSIQNNINIKRVAFCNIYTACQLWNEENERERKRENIMNIGNSSSALSKPKPSCVRSCTNKSQQRNQQNNNISTTKNFIPFRFKCVWVSRL